jgi:hypothetical protein
MDFSADVHAYVLSALPYDPIEEPTLKAKSAAELLVIYLNWLNRLIPALPRTAHQSKAIASNPIVTKRAGELSALIAKIEAGGDLRPHLSKDVRCGFQTARKGKRQRDLDLMLNDWQVHHLHLSGLIETDGFVTRDEPLLFAVFTGRDAYLIDVYDHRSWTKESVVHTLIDEWPTAPFVREIKGIRLTHGVTEQERGQRRKSGISSLMLEYKGKVWAVGYGGVTSAVTPVFATRRANFILSSLREREALLTNNPHLLDAQLVTNGIAPPSAPDFHFTVVPEGVCGIMERTSSAFWPIARLW